MLENAIFGEKMIDGFRGLEPPDESWLARCGEDSALPLRAILQDSLYYPGSGIDGDPVKNLGGNCISFVYCDCHAEWSKEKIVEQLEKDGTFSGFRLSFYREVTASELGLESFRQLEVPPNAVVLPPGGMVLKTPFALWAVFVRVSPKRCFERFSLLHVGGDAVCAYRELFRRQKLAPRVLAIIQPGNYGQRIWHPDGPLARLALGPPLNWPSFLLRNRCFWSEHWTKYFSVDITEQACAHGLVEYLELRRPPKTGPFLPDFGAQHTA